MFVQVIVIWFFFTISIYGIKFLVIFSSSVGRTDFPFIKLVHNSIQKLINRLEKQLINKAMLIGFCLRKQIYLHVSCLKWFFQKLKRKLLFLN